MLFILAALVAVMLLLAGLGRLAAFFLRPGPMDPWLHPWTGFFIAGMAGMAASITVPLNGYALLAFVTLGLAGLPLWLREYAGRAKKMDSAAAWMFLLAGLGYATLLASTLAWPEWPGKAPDTALYHAGVIRWLNEYGSPLGLANVHARFGFNTSWLVVAGLFDNGPLDLRVAWIMPALPKLGAFLYFLHIALFSEETTLRTFAFCMLPWGFLEPLGYNGPSLYYDQGALFFNALLVSECLRLLLAREDAPGQCRLVLCLGAAAFMIKPMAALSVAFTSGLVLFVLWKAGRLSIRMLFAVAWPAILAACVWIARNVVLTGFPLFPIPHFRLDLAWSLPPESAKANYDAVIGWARAPGAGAREALGNWGWVGDWLVRYVGEKRFWEHVGVPFITGALCWIVYLVRKPKSTGIFFGIWSFACLVYWFCSAPDIRFGNGFFHVFFAAGAAFAFHDPLWRLFRRIMRPRARKVLPTHTVAVLLCLAALALFARSGRVLSGHGKNLVTVGVIPEGTVAQRVLDDSVTPPVLLYYAPSGECVNSPLPCATADIPDLRSLVPGDVGGGFQRIR